MTNPLHTSAANIKDMEKEIKLNISWTLGRNILAIHKKERQTGKGGGCWQI